MRYCSLVSPGPSLSAFVFSSVGFFFKNDRMHVILLRRVFFSAPPNTARAASNSSADGRIKDKHLGDMRKWKRIGVLRLQNNTEKDSDDGAWRASD